jgi:hypothetical protein
MWIFQESFLEEAIFSPVYVLAPLSRSDNWTCAILYLGFLFYWICLHVCFCANTMLFLLQWLCSITWNLVLWYLRYCFFLVIITFTNQGILILPYKFWISFFRSCKEWHWWWLHQIHRLLSVE